MSVFRDGLRALWAMFYWNVRKSGYVLRGRKGRAPCQNPHDVQDGLTPRCEAVWNWEGPGRFHRVCPFLVRKPEGWRCSVPSTRVRPFWARAMGTYTLLALGLYLGAAGGLWLVWQAAGYQEIAWADVIWPGRWERVKPAQAEYFRKQGRTALQRGDYPAALLSLSTAETFVPGSYEERLLLARLWAQTGNVEFANRYFMGVAADFPDRAAEAATAWHDQLLASGQLAALADLCLQRVGASGEGAPESLWEYSLVFALEHGRLAKAMGAGQSPAMDKLPARTRGLIAVLAHWQRGERDEAARRLEAMRFKRDEPLAVRCQVEWLARLGRAGEAGLVLNRHAATLAEFERAALRYSIDIAAGDRDAARANFIGLLREPLTRAQADRLCGLVITARDGASLRRTPGFFALEPLKGDASTQAAFWVAALACREPALVAGARERYERASGGVVLPVMTELDFRKQSPTDRESPLFIASVVGLPRETVYALIGAGADAPR
ncbi:MAG: hypothetical protein K0R17_3002 [Rariglobus sp.]|jgi:tetratricopeptide (TPR) repeat protein|nr:hypothetical protein [Rariglobus sp.]